MATEIMLATEGASTSGVATDEVLDTVRVVGSQVGLEVEGPGEGTRALGALVLLAWITVAEIGGCVLDLRGNLASVAIDGRRADATGEGRVRRAVGRRGGIGRRGRGS